MPVTLTCTVCGRTFERPPSHVARAKEPTCSRHCNGINRARDLRPHTYRGGPTEATLERLRAQTGQRNPAWKGGSYIKAGYRMIRMPAHPRAGSNGYVREHIVVMEEMLGRPLEAGEEVHHGPGGKLDNRPENLKLYASHREHWVTEHLSGIIAARLAGASTSHTEAPAPP